MAVTIRTATPGDAAAIAPIYDHHARTGTASFDSEGLSALAWADKIVAITSRGWPFLVAERGGMVLGYAYATQFRDRAAYARTCENSIYVAADAVRQGVGTALLEALKAEASACGFAEMVAVVGGGEPSSMALHRQCGFEERGRLRHVGTKFGRRLDTVYLQCSLRAGEDA
ncbi:MAG: GNAT family N-acetyltransferase [Pseudomonadota bacterium]|nr:GNAT family N-acetyltransferase [Pseudomonadota bacterium]